MVTDDELPVLPEGILANTETEPCSVARSATATQRVGRALDF